MSPRNRKTNIIKEKNSNLPVDNFISLLTVIVGQPVKDGVFVTLCAPVVINGKEYKKEKKLKPKKRRKREK